jgi:hypothetical protein
MLSWALFLAKEDHACVTHNVIQITWLAPTTINFINMFLPSGTITVYARVSDFYGATSEEFVDTVVVNSPFGRRLLAFSWDLALSMVQDAVSRQVQETHKPEHYSMFYLWLVSMTCKHTHTHTHTHTILTDTHNLFAQSTADVNMLSACIATEANKAAKNGALTAERTSGIVGTLVTLTQQSVSSTPKTSEYVCEVANAMSSVTANSKHIDDKTLVPISTIVEELTSSELVVELTTDCGAQFYTSFNSVISAQNLLASGNKLSTVASAQVINTVESSGFRVMVLIAKSLIEGMTSTVSSDSATTVVSRELATSMSQTSTYTSQTKLSGTQVYTVNMPDLARALGLASSDKVDTVLDFSDNTPYVAGSQILSMGVGISLAKDGSKLVIANLSEPIIFTVPLIKAAQQAPPGLIVQCEYVMHAHA